LAGLLSRVVFQNAIAIIAGGYLAALVLAAYFMAQPAAGTELAFFTWWPILPITGGAVVLICILSSLISIRRVIVLEPAVVFRG
jgi:putative ABC transport system permease protein